MRKEAKNTREHHMSSLGVFRDAKEVVLGFLFLFSLTLFLRGL